MPTPYTIHSVFYLPNSQIQALFDKFIVSPTRSEAERSLYQGVMNSSATVQFPAPSEEVIEALKKYATLRRTYDIDNPQAFTSNHDKSLHDSTSKWLRDNDLEALFPLFWYYGTTFGYGHPNDIPTIYFVKLLGDQILVALEEIHETVFTVQWAQFQSLLNAMVESLDGPLFLDTTIEYVSYESNFNTIEYRVNGGSKQEMMCQSIIIAFAPTKDAMELFTPPTNQTILQSLFEEVRTTPYYSILYKDENGDFASGASVSYRIPDPSHIPDHPAENLLYIKQQPNTPSSVVAYYNPNRTRRQKRVNERIQLQNWSDCHRSYD